MTETIQELLEKHKGWLEDDVERGLRLTTKLLNSVQWDNSKDLQEANLQEANLRGAKLQGANLQGAYLEWANLRGANLEEAKLQGADLTCAILTDEQKDYVLNKGAVIND